MISKRYVGRINNRDQNPGLSNGKKKEREIASAAIKQRHGAPDNSVIAFFIYVFSSGRAILPCSTCCARIVHAACTDAFREDLPREILNDGATRMQTITSTNQISPPSNRTLALLFPSLLIPSTFQSRNSYRRFTHNGFIFAFSRREGGILHICSRCE